MLATLKTAAITGFSARRPQQGGHQGVTAPSRQGESAFPQARGMIATQKRLPVPHTWGILVENPDHRCGTEID